MAQRDAVKRDARTLEAEISRLQELLAAAKKKQPKQGRGKPRPDRSAGGVAGPAPEHEESQKIIEGMKRSIVEPTGYRCCCCNCCCVIV